MKTKTKLMKIEFGVMSNKYSVKCENKYIGYIAILLQYANNPGMVAIYSPDECKQDAWTNFSGKTEEQIEILFKEFGGMVKFIEANKKEISIACKTIKKII